MDSAKKQIYRFADVEINTSQNSLKRGEHREHLRQKAFSVLIHLIEHRQRTVSKEELMDIFWKDTAVTDDSLVQCIKEIRRAVGDDSHQSRFIKTIPKTGYMFIGDVEFVEDSSPKSVDIYPVEEKIFVKASSFKEIFNARRVFLAILFFIVVFSILGFLGWNPRQNEINAANIVLPQIAGKKSIVVLYFENQTSDEEFDWMREGLADMLITNLSHSNKTNVLSRQQFHLLLEKTGFQANKQVPFEQAINIARRSRAENFITGSFAKINSEIRINVQLHETESGALLAAENLTVEKPEQILTGIDLLSAKLAKNFGIDENESQTNLAGTMTNDLEAYRCYSLAVEKAQALHNKEAIALLEKAIKLDPQFAMAYARIGYAYAVTWGFAEKGKPYLEKAFKLSQKLSEQERSNIKAWYEIADLDFPAAIQTYRDIINKYPLESEGYWRLGRLLDGEESLEDAVEVLKKGLIIDPENKDIYNTLGGIYSELGDHESAIAARRQYVALAPSEANAYDSLGLAYQWAGDYPKAIENYNRSLELNPTFEIALIHLANTRYQTGQFRESENLFHRYIEIAPSEIEKARGWDGIAQIHLQKREFPAAEKAAAEILKINKDWARIAYLTAIEKGDLKQTLNLEKVIFAKAKNTDRGARLKQRFEYYARGYIALKRNLSDEAIADFQDALRRKPPIWNIDSFEDSLANAYLQLGKTDEAIAEYQRILQLNPNYPLARFHLAQAYKEKGFNDEARNSFRLFLQTWQNADEDIPEVIFAKNFLAQS